MQLGYIIFKNRKWQITLLQIALIAIGGFLILGHGPTAHASNPVLTQQDYRWYTNVNQLTPTSSLALENTAITNVSSTFAIRLRINILASSTGITLAAGQQFKLQYSTSTTSGWADIGGMTSSTIWRGYDNNSASTTDGATIKDTLLVQSGAVQTYEEENPSAGTPNALPVATTTLGQYWVLATDSANWIGRFNHGALVYDGKMWIFGGAASDSFDKNDVWYSTNGISWTQATSGANWSARSDLGGTTVFQDKMWVAGGNTLNDVWYSTSGIVWTQATSGANWSARFNHRMLTYDNKMWVMGGRDGSFNYLNDVWYSTDGVNWTQATSGAAWTARNSFGVVVFQNKMWVMGGLSPGGLLNDVWYSTNGINWTRATSGANWSIRSFFGTAVYDNKMWVMGSRDGSAGTGSTNDVWYSGDGVTWTQATASAPWTRGYAPGVLQYNNKLWVLGGASTTYSDATGSVWFSQGNGAGEWDWTLQNNSAAATTTYYFRLVNSDGTALNAYTNYPTLTTAVGTSYVDCGLRAYDGSSTIAIACEPSGTLTSALRIRKNGTTYGIVVVPTNDANASRIRIQTASGTRSLRKYP